MFSEPFDRRIDTPDGLQLAVQDHGGPTDAATILLVHGYPDDHHVWDLVVEQLRPHHRIITFDVRGTGASMAPAGRSGYRLEHLVTDIDTVATTVSPNRPVHLVGHDWGSIQGWSTVLRPDATERYASFTSMSGPALEHVARWIRGRRRPGVRRWTEALAQGMRSWYVYAFHSPLAPMAWRHGLTRRWPTLLRRAEPVQTDDAWPGPDLQRNAVNGISLYRANMLPALRTEPSATTSVPVQLVIARHDRFVGPTLLDGIEDLASDLVRTQLDAGHWALRSHAGLVAARILEHVARNSVPQADHPEPPLTA